jgi:hypothetical protein
LKLERPRSSYWDTTKPRTVRNRSPLKLAVDFLRPQLQRRRVQTARRNLTRYDPLALW